MFKLGTGNDLRICYKWLIAETAVTHDPLAIAILLVTFAEVGYVDVLLPESRVDVIPVISAMGGHI